MNMHFVTEDEWISSWNGNINVLGIKGVKRCMVGGNL